MRKEGYFNNSCSNIFVTLNIILQWIKIENWNGRMEDGKAILRGKYRVIIISQHYSSLLRSDFSREQHDQDTIRKRNDKDDQGVMRQRNALGFR